MPGSIQHIGVVGSGNVAWHLSRHLKENGIDIAWVYSRNASTGRELAEAVSSEYQDHLPPDPVDLVLICVQDDAIANVLKDISPKQAVAYTSGTRSLSDFSFSGEIGVFYPLQTFSRQREINLFEVPFFIEASNTTFAQQLFDLAWKLSKNVKFANSEQRGELHVAAVLVNNFSNHLFYLAKQYLDAHQLDWHDLQPLMKETVAKLDEMDPYDAQTGPARRHDEATIAAHLEKLPEEWRALYDLLTKQITKTYTK